MNFIRGFYNIRIDCLTATSLAVPRVETVAFMILGSALQQDFVLQQDLVTKTNGVIWKPHTLLKEGLFYSIRLAEEWISTEK